MVQGQSQVSLCGAYQQQAYARTVPGLGAIARLGARVAALILLGALSAVRVDGQRASPRTNAEMLPSFEVATIRPSKPGTFHQDLDESGNRLTIQNYTVRHLVREAYGLKSDSQILGGPDWIDKESFDITGKVDDDEAARMDKMTDEQSDHEWELMLQSLLADRFQLKITQGDRTLPIFALVVSRSGAKVKHTPERSANSQAGDPGIEVHWGELTANAASMDSFADVLTSMRDMSNRVVVNRTGLAGNFDFQLDWARDRGDGASQDSPYPGLFTALQEQLGLKLKADRATVNVVIVDSVTEPTRN